MQAAPIRAQLTSVTLNDTHTFSPTLLLTGTLGFTRGAERISAYNGAGGVTDPLSKLGFPSYLNSNGFMGVPAMFIDQCTYYSAGYTNIGGDPYGNYKQGQDTGQLTVAVNKIIGDHGVESRIRGTPAPDELHPDQCPERRSSTSIDPASSQCPYDFATCGGDGMASFLMGQMRLRRPTMKFRIGPPPRTINMRGMSRKTGRRPQS